MSGLILHIGWEYFLGIFAGLIIVAWYTNGRFAALETSMKWIEAMVRDLKVSADNARRPAFASDTPVNLKPLGKRWLLKSGLKAHVDGQRDQIFAVCEVGDVHNPYDVQRRMFAHFDTLMFERPLEDQFRLFAYGEGTTTAVLRRVGAIYARDLCLDHLGMKSEVVKRKTGS